MAAIRAAARALRPSREVFWSWSARSAASYARSNGGDCGSAMDTMLPEGCDSSARRAENLWERRSDRPGAETVDQNRLPRRDDLDAHHACSSRTEPRKGNHHLLLRRRGRQRDLLQQLPAEEDLCGSTVCASGDDQGQALRGHLPL